MVYFVPGGTGGQLIGNFKIENSTLTTTTTDPITITGSDGTPNDVVIASGGGTKNVVLDSQRWPNAIGSNGQILQTDGSGVLSWVNATGGASSLTDITNLWIFQ